MNLLWMLALLMISIQDQSSHSKGLPESCRYGRHIYQPTTTNNSRWVPKGNLWYLLVNLIKDFSLHHISENVMKIFLHTFWNKFHPNHLPKYQFCIYIYIYIYMCVYIYICIYIMYIHCICILHIYHIYMIIINIYIYKHSSW